VLLMAPVLQEWIPEGDLAHFVSDLVESGTLDLSAIYDAYERNLSSPVRRFACEFSERLPSCRPAC